ncbi:DUF357 domain-containing protein [Candidatus Woesearchaeota archaeon]|nr:DUF357 domain-containing protein [Candidatus Woesearchaeota archaeon]
MKNKITKDRMEKYLKITKEALDKVKNSEIDKKRKEFAEDLLDMSQRYYDDALHYHKKGDWVTAFAAVNYSHAWLDAGARIGLFKVVDNRLFTVD